VKALIERVRNEPALALGLISAVISLALAFGFTLTDEQVGGIMAVVVAFLALVTRSKVVALRRVEAYQTVQGETVTGPAAPPEGQPAEVVTPGDVSYLDQRDGVGRAPGPEQGAMEVGSVLVALACIVVVLCGLVWLIQNL
jgi:hypothetical protein